MTSSEARVSEEHGERFLLYMVAPAPRLQQEQRMLSQKASAGWSRSQEKKNWKSVLAMNHIESFKKLGIIDSVENLLAA